MGKVQERPRKWRLERGRQIVHSVGDYSASSVVTVRLLQEGAKPGLRALPRSATEASIWRRTSSVARFANSEPLAKSATRQGFPQRSDKAHPTRPWPEPSRHRPGPRPPWSSRRRPAAASPTGSRRGTSPSTSWSGRLADPRGRHGSRARHRPLAIVRRRSRRLDRPELVVRVCERQHRQTEHERTELGVLDEFRLLRRRARREGKQTAVLVTKRTNVDDRRQRAVELDATHSRA